MAAAHPPISKRRHLKKNDPGASLSRDFAPPITPPIRTSSQIMRTSPSPHDISGRLPLLPTHAVLSYECRRPSLLCIVLILSKGECAHEGDCTSGVMRHCIAEFFPKGAREFLSLNLCLHGCRCGALISRQRDDADDLPPPGIHGPRSN